MYYASFGLLAIVIHCIINFWAMRRPREEDVGSWRCYRHFLGSTLLYYVTDVLWGFLYESKIVLLAYVDTAVYFFAMGLTVLLWMRFIVAYIDRDSFRSKLLLIGGWIIFGIQIVILLFNFFTRYMFWFDETGEYYPEQGRYLALGFQVFLFAVLTVYMLILSFRVNGLDAVHYRAIGCSSVMMLVFIILQTLYPFLPFYAIGCLLATCIIHTFLGMDERVTLYRRVGSIKQMAYTDPLTNVKSKLAYTEAVELFDAMIRERTLQELGVAVFDVNDLKLVNDTKGHEAGDLYLQEASRLICSVFKHSPVYRIGGDEFVAVLESEDFIHSNALFTLFDDIVDDNQKKGRAVVAGGYDVYQPEQDPDFETIFRRADAKMYERKKELKSRKK